MAHKGPIIKILDPPQGKPSCTSLRKANLYVALGDAYWEDGAIRFYPPRTPVRVIDSQGYDEVGQMRPNQLRGLHLNNPTGKVHSRIQTRGIRSVVKTNLSLY